MRRFGAAILLLLAISIARTSRADTATAAAAASARAPNVVVVTAEQEYHAKETLPAFFKEDVEPKLGFQATLINSDSTTDIPKLEALDDADLLVMFVRRRTLPAEQLDHFKRYLARGKPLVGLRTSSHALENWRTFDREVLGCTYGAHNASSLTTSVRVAPGGEKHAILDKVKPFESHASLYRSSPLAKTTTPLLIGKAGDNPEQPVAWTNVLDGGGVTDKRKVFYTSLGHPDDFKTPEFKQLLVNAIAWALDRDLPK